MFIWEDDYPDYYLEKANISIVSSHSSITELTTNSDVDDPPVIAARARSVFTIYATGRC